MWPLVVQEKLSDPKEQLVLFFLIIIMFSEIESGEFRFLQAEHTMYLDLD